MSRRIFPHSFRIKMSRRKQQNPKPLKKSENAISPLGSSDNLKILKEKYSLPNEVLTLGVDPEHNPRVVSTTVIPRGSAFGPYVVDTNESSHDYCLKFQSEESSTTVTLPDSAKWLTLCSNPEHIPANCQATFDGKLLWCEVTEDIQSGEPLSAVLLDFPEAVKNHKCETKTEAISKISNAILSPPEKSMYKCDYCSIQFSNLSRLTAHLTHYCSLKPSELNLPTKETNNEDLVKKDVILIDQPTINFKEQKRFSLKENIKKTIKNRRNPLSSFPNSMKRSLSMSRSKRPYRRLYTRDKQSPQAMTNKETYCSACHIQYSSMHTYRAHRDYYCQRTKPELKLPSDTDISISKDNKMKECRETSIAEIPVSLCSASDFPIGQTNDYCRPYDVHGVVQLATNEHSERTTQIISSGQTLYIPRPFTSLDHQNLPNVIPTFIIQPMVHSTPQSENIAFYNSTMYKKAENTEENLERTEDLPLDLSFSKDNVKKLNELDTVNEKEKHDRDEISKGRLNKSENVQFASKIMPTLQNSPYCSINTDVDQLNRSIAVLPTTTPSKKPTECSSNKVNKCSECNIVFYRRENYLAHKRHYCKRNSSPIVAQEKKSLDQLEINPILRHCCSDQKSHVSPSVVYEGPARKYICTACNITFSGYTTLKAHKIYYCPYSIQDDRMPKTTISNNRAYRCRTCSKNFLSLELLYNHAGCEQNFPLRQKCRHCEFSAITEARILEHSKVHEPSKVYKCALCGYRGHTIRGMRMHGKLHSGFINEYEHSHILEFEVPPSDPPFLNSYDKLSNDSEIIRLKNLPYKRRKSRKSIEKSEHYRTMAVDKRRFQCPICYKHCMSALSLSLHLREHVDTADELDDDKYDDSPYCSSESSRKPHNKVSPKDKSNVLVTSCVKNTDVQQNENQSESNTIKIKVENTQDEPSYEQLQTNQNDYKDDKLISSENLYNQPLGEECDQEINVDNDNSNKYGARDKYIRNITINSCSDTKDTVHKDLIQNYCEACNISFRQASTFQAHKKYYCNSDKTQVENQT